MKKYISIKAINISSFIRNSFVLAILISLSYNAQLAAQTVLGPGDIAITGYNADNPDRISFVLLTDVDATTTLSFTDLGWYADGFRGNEGTITIAFNSAQSCGQSFHIRDSISSGSYTLMDTSNITVGTVTESDSGFSLPESGDQILVYQDPIPTTSNSSSWVAGINYNGGSGWLDPSTLIADGSAGNSTLPSALTDGLNAFSFTSGNPDNGTYDCSTLMGTQDELLTAINNPGNWATSSTDTNINNCAFVCVAAPDPSEVPTMSQWGLICLALLMMIFGITYSRNEKLIPAFNRIKK